MFFINEASLNQNRFWLFKIILYIIFNREIMYSMYRPIQCHWVRPHHLHFYVMQHSSSCYINLKLFASLLVTLTFLCQVPSPSIWGKKGLSSINSWRWVAIISQWLVIALSTIILLIVLVSIGCPPPTSLQKSHILMKISHFG